MKKSSTLLLIILAAALTSFSQQTTKEKAWEFFINNDLKSARDEFAQVIRSNPDDYEAHLMLSLIAGENDAGESALNHFADFANVAPDINPYMSALWYTASVAHGVRSKKERYRERFLTDMLKSDNLNSTTRAYLNETLGDHYRMSADLRKAESFFAEIGSVTEWQIVGTFYNEAGSGFEKGYPPIHSPGGDIDFINDFGAPVRWYKMVNAQPGQWLHLVHYFDTRNSLMYAQTFCHSPVDQEVVLRIGTSGSLRVWGNDKLLFSEADERNNGIDTYLVTARLNKGHNRILLQLGSSRIARSNFLMRVTDRDGNIAKDLEFTSNLSTYVKDTTDWQPEAITHFAEAFFQEKVQEEPNNLLNYIMLASVYLKNDKTYQAKSILNQALEKWPDCTYLLEKQYEAYLRDDNPTGVTLTRDKILKADPDNPGILLSLYSEAYDNENYQEAKNMLDRYERKMGRNAAVINRRISLAIAEDKTVELHRLINEGFNKFPENAHFVRLKHLSYKSQRNIPKATSTLRKFLRRNFDADLTITYGVYLAETGRMSQGMDVLKQLIVYSPSATGYIALLADINSRIGNYRRATSYYEQCLVHAPYVDTYHEYLGDCHSETANLPAALSSYRQALKFNPNNFSLRNKIRELEGTAPIFDFFEKPDLDALIKQAPEAADHPGESSIILLHEVQKVAYAGGGQEEKHFYLVKVFNSDGLDNWKEVDLYRFANQRIVVEKAEVIKRNGSTLKAEVYNDQVVFTALEVGDAIALVYKLETFSYGKLVPNFSDVYHFSAMVPTKTARFSLLTEKGMTFERQLVNTRIKLDIEDFNNYRRYTWEKHDLPAVRYEVFMPAMADVGETIHISTLPDWNFVIDWYHDLTISQARTHLIVQEKARELLADKGDLTDLEKTKVIYDYVTNEIRYSSIPLRQSGFVPQRASNVVSTLIGDCKDVVTLFIALCNEAGITATPVLIRSRSNGNTLPLPTMDFDHVIARAEIDGEFHYLELTSSQLPFGALHPELYKALALEVSPEPQKSVPFLLDPENRLRNTIQRNTEVIFDGEKMNVATNTVRGGYPSAGMRMVYQNITEEEQKRILATSITSSAPDINLIHLGFDEHLAGNSNLLSYDYNFVRNNPFTRITGLEIFRIPFTDTYDDSFFIADATRKFPLELRFYNVAEEFTEELIIHIPEGKELAEMPEDMEFECSVGRYKVVFGMEDNKLVANRELTYFNDVVTPDEYVEFKDFFMKMLASDTRQIALKNKAGH